MFQEWVGFYSMLGTAAATLVGLTFIALTLGGQMGGSGHRYVPLFVTPTVVHFSMVLMISAVLLVPGLSARSVAAGLATIGVGCALYMVTVGYRFWHARLEAVRRYTWIWHAAVPGAAYMTLAGAAGVLGLEAGSPAYVVAGVALFLMAVALRDAWATVVWIAGHSASPK